jgi:hypothetical protein
MRRQLDHSSRPRRHRAPQNEVAGSAKRNWLSPTEFAAAPQSRVGGAAGNSLTAPPECTGAAVACFQGGVHTTY